jgi:nucleotide-binding universal stress UspA family protein
MSAVLAAIDSASSAPSILRAAEALADLLHSSVRVIHVCERPDVAAYLTDGSLGMEVEIVDGEPATEIVNALADPNVLLAVIGTRDDPAGPRSPGHTALEVVARVDKPVVIVPPRPADAVPGRPLHRILVPLEGTTESTDAVSVALQPFAEGGAELIALHVFDASTVPRFWDQSAHASHSYAAAFESQWCDMPTADVHLRRGAAPATVINVADDERVDLIALGWRQDLSVGRATIVRAALAHTIPVLLVPLTMSDDESG